MVKPELWDLLQEAVCDGIGSRHFQRFKMVLEGQDPVNGSRFGGGKRMPCLWVLSVSD